MAIILLSRVAFDPNDVSSTLLLWCGFSAAPRGCVFFRRSVSSDAWGWVDRAGGGGARAAQVTHESSCSICLGPGADARDRAEIRLFIDSSVRADL